MMKKLNTIVKIVTALAAVAGAIYVVAAYGDKIVEWAKKLWASMPKCPSCECTDTAADEEFEEAPQASADEEVPAEEPAEEAPVEETPVEETPEPAPVANEPVAEDHDFAE